MASPYVSSFFRPSAAAPTLSGATNASCQTEDDDATLDEARDQAVAAGQAMQRTRAQLPRARSAPSALMGGHGAFGRPAPAQPQPRPTTVDPTAARKFKVAAAHCGALPQLRDKRTKQTFRPHAALYETGAVRYLGGPSVAFGSSAKLVPLVRLDDGAHLVAKSLRNVPVRLAPHKHPTLSRFGCERTGYVRDRAFFAQAVDNEVALSRLFGGAGAIGHVFATPKATFLTMPAMDCDLADAASLCTDAERRTLARVVAPQLIDRLQRLHAAGVAHFDFKPHNVLFDLGALRVELGDFGSSRALDPRSRRAPYMGSATFPPPELLPESLSRYRREAARTGSAKTDAWALGVTLLMVLVGPERHSWTDVPFYHASRTLCGYSAWRAGCFPGGDYAPVHVADDAPFSRYVRQAMAIDLPLTQLVLDTCLQPNERRRADLAQFRARLVLLDDGGRDAATLRELRAALIERGQGSALTQIFDGLDELRDELADRMAQEEAQDA